VTLLLSSRGDGLGSPSPYIVLLTVCAARAAPRGLIDSRLVDSPKRLSLFGGGWSKGQW